MTEDQRNDGTIRDLHAMGNPDNLYTSSEGGYGMEEGPFENRLPTGIVATGQRPTKFWAESSLERSKAIGKMRGPYMSRGT